ncbi:MAG: metallophosphoesterase [Candidatus Margulisbacteria bacterium]|nr:metallophosphoesterase [Candidatus Margulisiibacteriota bacterium]
MIWGSPKSYACLPARQVLGTMSAILLLVVFFALPALSMSTSPQESFSFVVFGDNQGNDRVFNKIIDSINHDPYISFAVHVGDMVDSPTEKEYQHFLGLIKRLNVKMFPTMGNHDAVYGGDKRFNKYFGRVYYSFDHKNSHFIVMDNSLKNSFGKKQFDWLITDLEKNKKVNTFVFFHKPLYDPSGIFLDYIMSSRETAEKLMDVFKTYHVKYVFFGHIHGYARSVRAGTTYILSGGAGGPLHLPPALGGFYHYVKITVKGDKIKSEVIKIDAQER